MPVRTCVACRQRFEQAELVRVRASGDGVEMGPGPGRGAYVGASPACLRLAVERKALGRALRVEVNAPDVARLSSSWPVEPSACPHGGG